MNEIQKRIITLLSERCDAIDASHLSNESRTVRAELIFDEPDSDFVVWVFENGDIFIHSAEDEEYAEAEIDKVIEEIKIEEKDPLMKCAKCGRYIHLSESYPVHPETLENLSYEEAKGYDGEEKLVCFYCL